MGGPVGAHRFTFPSLASARPSCARISMSDLATLEQLELILEWSAWINYYSVSAVAFLLYDAGT